MTRIADSRPAVLALIVACSGLEVEFSDLQRPRRPEDFRTIILLSFSEPRALSGLRRKMTFDVGADDNFETVRGSKAVTLSIHCESYEEGAPRIAFETLELVRDRLHFTSSIDALNAAGFGLIRTERLADLSEDRGDRWASIALLDVQLSFETVEVNPVPTGVIEIVNVGGLLVEGTNEIPVDFVAER